MTMNRRALFPSLLAAAAVVAGTAFAGPNVAGGQPHDTVPHVSVKNNFGCKYYYGNELTAEGNRGDRVRQVQCLLSKWDYMDPGEVDGVFGPHTREQVAAFQSDLDLKRDGKVGVKTWAALRCETGRC